MSMRAGIWGYCSELGVNEQGLFLRILIGFPFVFGDKDAPSFQIEGGISHMRVLWQILGNKGKGRSE